MKKANDILLVEDYEPDARLLRILLKRNKVANEMHVVSDGLTALDWLFRRGAHHEGEASALPGAVLLDTRLPKLDGWEVLQRIKQDARTKDIPVVMLSGSLFGGELEKCRNLGAVGCLEKPIQFAALDELLAGADFKWVRTAAT